MKELSFLKHNLTIPNALDNFLFQRRERREHPDRLPTDGIICFCGMQGTGKTLSAVNYVYNVAKAFPNALICTNAGLNFPDLANEIIPYTGIDQMLELDNGEYGIIFFLDEMHIEFNSLESKGMDSNIFQLVSQQRKARKHIVGTSQVFGRLAKPFREQFKYAVLCDNFHSLVFRQEVYSAMNISSNEDITVKLRPIAVKFYFPSSEDFQRYDTTQIIERIRGGF